VYVGFLPQQLIDHVDGVAHCEAAIEVCRPWAACLASFGRRKRQVCGFVCGFSLMCSSFRIGGVSRFIAHAISFQFDVFVSTSSLQRSNPALFFVMFFLTTVRVNWFL
jgi:hypothetical protein